MRRAPRYRETYIPPPPPKGQWIADRTGSELRFGPLRARVHRSIHMPPEDWFLTCSPMFDCREIGSGTLEEAQEAACRLLRETLAFALADLPKEPTP